MLARRGSAASASTRARSSRRRSGPRSSPPSETAPIRALLADPDRRTNKAARRYLLARPAQLQPLRRDGWSRGPRRAASAAMPARRAPASPAAARPTSPPTTVEQFVSEAVLHRLDSPQLQPRSSGGTQRPGRRALVAGSRSGTAQLDELAAAYGSSRSITMPSGMAAREADRAAADRRPQAAREGKPHDRARPPTSATAPGCARDWDALDLSQQHAIVAAVLDHVVVGPAPPRLQPLRRVAADAGLAALSEQLRRPSRAPTGR